MSNFSDWDQKPHAKEWLLFPENIGEVLCLDEVALSDGELYTILTNAKNRSQNGSLVAIIEGVKSEKIIDILTKIPSQKRAEVKYISVDMANNMGKIASSTFPKASVVTDRFHVAKLVTEAVQSIRIKYRWEAIEKENILIAEAKKNNQKYIAETFENGDTEKQLLARSRYLLFKSLDKWTEKQTNRSKILFSKYTQLQEAYNLSMNFRNIYQHAKSKEDAKNKINDWIDKVNSLDIKAFNTAANSIKNHMDNILNFFPDRITNAMAENFNSKLKSFRAQFRGVKDLEFFLYRIALIFA